ncbi:phosphoserine phosphatase SerB [Coralliovum pocilloporae]|uniref:phosphoserine phosphatase SerB n=1 Tax=Coralliovum pocilloporae TaxID=3066369 RepID=UPI0033070376
MSLVATLVAAPKSRVLDPDFVKNLDALPWITGTKTLSDEQALDLQIAETEQSEKTIEETIRQLCGNRPVDILVQPQTNRRKQLFLADMDSTMIGQECIDELAAELGLKDHIAAITERAMRGEIAFEPALKERVALLKGLDLSVVDTVIRDRITLTEGARTLIQTMRHHGTYCALVSGGFTVFTDRIAGMLGFHENRANILHHEDGILTGDVGLPILGRDAKRDRLLALRDEHSIPADATMAVGDGANDLAMLSEASIGIAWRAKPAVAEQANARIDHADMTALLYAQGYHQDDFVTG